MATIYGAIVRDESKALLRNEPKPTTRDETKTTQQLSPKDKLPEKTRDPTRLAPGDLPPQGPGIIKRVLNRVRSNSDLTRRPEPSRRRKSFKTTKEVALSRELWEEAYDSLRLNPSTTSLVVTYEAIISQELPDEVKAVVHGQLSPSDGDRERRMELMSAIVGAGLGKRRGSRGVGGVEDMPRVVLECSKRMVERAWDEFPSAALAWAGLCTLTPVSLPFTTYYTMPTKLMNQLLLDPILRHKEFNKGMLHIIGRIPWYMHLPILLKAAARHDADDLALRQNSANEQRCTKAVLLLYRRVLELEMNCVLASASAWNSVARHTVRWNSLESLNEDVRQADEAVKKLVEEEVGDGPRERLLAWEQDLDISEMVGRIEEEVAVIE